MVERDEDSRRQEPPRRLWPGWPEALARAFSVMAFGGSAALALIGAWISATEEAYTSWGQPQAVAFSAMAGASVAAAGLAMVRRGGVLAHIAGVAVLVPAWPLLSAASPTVGSPSTREQWLAAVAAWGLVVAGGVIASGLGPWTHRSPHG